MKLLLLSSRHKSGRSDSYQECVQIVIDSSIGLDVNLAEYMIDKIDLTRESYVNFDLLPSNTINVWLAGNPAYILEVQVFRSYIWNT